MASNCLSTSILAGLPGDQLFLVVESFVVIHQVVVENELVIQPALVLPGDDVADLLVLDAALDGDVLVGADVDLHAVTDRHVFGLGATNVG